MCCAATAAGSCHTLGGLSRLHFGSAAIITRHGTGVHHKCERQRKRNWQSANRKVHAGRPSQALTSSNVLGSQRQRQAGVEGWPKQNDTCDNPQ